MHKGIFLAILMVLFSSHAWAETTASCETLGIALSNSGPTLASCAPAANINSAYIRSENAAARANYGVLGVQGLGEIQDAPPENPPGGGVATAFTSTASFSDSASFTSATATVGSLVFDFSINGATLVTGSGTFGPEAGANYT